MKSVVAVARDPGKGLWRGALNVDAGRRIVEDCVGKTVSVGDVYRADPTTSLTGDAHGSKPRPIAVVECRQRVAVTLTRTTHPGKDARRLESPADPAIGLTKGGWWTDASQRPIFYKHFADAKKLKYLGRLSEEQTDELVGFWNRTKMLGRESR